MKLLTKLFCAITFVLTACSTLGPDYHRPQFDTPQKLTVTTKIPKTPANEMDWWKSFQDSAFDNLLAEAEKNNQELKLAIARIEEASGILAVTRSDSAPSVDATISAYRNRRSENTSQSFSNQTPVNRNIRAGLNASYELDLWGKLRRASEADRAHLLAQQANSEAVRITLSTQIAQNYFALRATDEQLSLIEAAVKTRQDSIRLQKKRFSAGIIHQATLHQAEAELAATEINLQQRQQTQAQLASALAVLLGRTPSEITHPMITRGKSITALHQKLTIPKLSSDLFNHRPDLIAAEQNLVAANANIGQAKTLFFPAISLTAGTGYESQALKNLIDPASLLWNIGASLAQPIYHHGSVKGVTAAAQARKNQALAQYIQAVQNAFRDTHDALAHISANEKIFEAKKTLLSSAQDTLHLTELRYRSGYSSLLEPLEAKQHALQAQSNLIDAQYDQLVSVVSLYKAVGGHWEK